MFTIFCNPGAASAIQDAVTSPAVTIMICAPELDLMAARIRQASCRILCYWEIGSDTLNYFLPFFRLAPVQCLDWGTPYTSGIPTVDYYISSALMEPPEAANHYSERLIQLPDIHTYHPRPQLPDELLGREEFGLDDDVNIYLCAQNPLKIHPDFDGLAAEILRRDPNGVLLLINKAQHHMDQLRARMERTIPDVVDRVITRTALSAQEYFSLLTIADVALDTPHYSGMNITYDTLVAGTPVVTSPGKWMRGRYTYAIYRKLSIMDCVVRNLDQYADVAVGLATNPTKRALVSLTIRRRVDMLFENDLVVAEFERVFDEIGRYGPNS